MTISINPHAEHSYMLDNKVVKYILFCSLLSLLLLIGYYWVLPSLGLLRDGKCLFPCVALPDQKPYTDPSVGQMIFPLILFRRSFR